MILFIVVDHPDSAAYCNAKKKQDKNNYSCSNELGSCMNIMLCDIEIESFNV